MKTKIAIGLLCIAAILAWAGAAGSQAAPATPKVQLPNGDTVWDLSGHRDALIENSGPMAEYGTSPNVYRITQTCNAFDAIRLKDIPPPRIGPAGSPSLLGELDTSGFKRVELVTTSGARAPIKWQISEDGKEIVIEDGWSVKVTLTRP